MITIKTIEDRSLLVYKIQRTLGFEPRKNVDHVFIDLYPGRKYKTILYVSMHTDENYNGLEVLKLKCWCERNNYGLCFWGSLNQLPLLSLVADQMLLNTYPQALDRIYEADGPSVLLLPAAEDYFSSHYVKQIFFDLQSAGRFLGGRKLPLILDIADVEISDEEMVERFKHPTVYVRESTFSLYDNLKADNIIRDNLLITEFERSGAEGKNVSIGTLSKNIEGLGLELAPDQLKRTLLKRCGLNYMAIQFLAGVLSNWIYFCQYGSSNLFAFLPVKSAQLIHSRYFSSEHVRKLAIARFGELGKKFPFLVPGLVQCFRQHVGEFKEFQALELPVQIIRNADCRTTMTQEEKSYFNVKED